MVSSRRGRQVLALAGGLMQHMNYKVVIITSLPNILPTSCGIDDLEDILAITEYFEYFQSCTSKFPGNIVWLPTYKWIHRMLDAPYRNISENQMLLPTTRRSKLNNLRNTRIIVVPGCI